MDKDKGDDEKRYCCGCDILSISTTVVILTLIITLFVTLSAALVVKEDSKMFFKNGTFAGKEVKTLKKPLTGVVATYAIWSVSSFVGYIGCAQMNWILLGQFFVVSILCKVFTLLGIVVVLGNGHFTIFFEFELTGGLMVFGFFILIGEALGQVIVFRTTRYMFGLAKEDSRMSFSGMVFASDRMPKRTTREKLSVSSGARQAETRPTDYRNSGQRPSGSRRSGWESTEI